MKEPSSGVQGPHEDGIAGQRRLAKPSKVAIARCSQATGCQLKHEANHLVYLEFARDRTWNLASLILGRTCLVVWKWR